MSRDWQPADAPGSAADGAHIQLAIAAAVAATWAVVPLGSHPHWNQYAGSALLAVTAAAIRSAAGRYRPGAGSVTFACALVLLGAVGLLRNSVGGLGSGAGALAMIPVFYTALSTSSRRQLAAVIAGVGLFYVVPIVFIGAPEYPPSQYRVALLSVTVSSIVGFATQRLVAVARSQAEEAQARGRMLEQISAVLQALFESPDPRRELCRAVESVSGAAAVALYEPERGSENLRCTAATLAAADAVGVRASERSAVRAVAESAQPLLATENVGQRAGSGPLWRQSGTLGCILYQPLVRQGTVSGVLVAGWPADVADDVSRRTVAALLAREAAGAIARADMIDRLADQAETDPLTGLPNRRSWDAHLSAAFGAGQCPTIVLLDLDHFKRFNDTYGHPAGDRLLKETAAAWRAQLRSGDLLARLGGEEFGLLMLDASLQTATDITERLRSHVTHDQTCSAGVACTLPGEEAAAVVARADRALYAAKSRGRDQIQLSAA